MATFSINVTVKATTDKAVLVEDEDGKEEWVPVSQIDASSAISEESMVDDEGELVMTEWIARKKGWL
jgi:hypothetical protein